MKATRKQFNHDAAKAARKAKAYDVVVGEPANWAKLDRSLAPAKAVAVLLASLEPSAPATLEPIAPVTPPVVEPARKALSLTGSVENLTEVLTGAIDTAYSIPLRSKDAGTFGGARVVVKGVHHSSRLGLAMKIVGFEFRNGAAELHVAAPGRAIDQYEERAENVAAFLGLLGLETVVRTWTD